MKRRIQLCKWLLGNLKIDTVENDINHVCNLILAEYGGIIFLDRAISVTLDSQMETELSDIRRQR